MNITCLLKGHDLQIAKYAGARESKTPLSACIDFDGSLHISQAPSIGFMHYGMISECLRCGKVVDADNLSLPILEPDFNAKAE